MKELNLTVQTYSKIAKIYDVKHGKLSEIEKFYLNYFYKLVNSVSSLPRILDVGCGTGRDLAYLKRFRGEFYGVDLSEGMLEISKRKLKKVNLIRADARYLPFSDKFFDGILSVAMLHIYLV